MSKLIRKLWASENSLINSNFYLFKKGVSIFIFCLPTLLIVVIYFTIFLFIKISKDNFILQWNYVEATILLL